MRLLFIFCLLFSSQIFSQEDSIARDYFDNGDFEKALYEYKELYTKAPSNLTYISQIVSAHQQLEQYAEAEAFLLKLLERVNYPAFLVELGYNYQLQNKLDKANTAYNKALASVNDKPSNVFSVAKSFQTHVLLNEAIAAYENAMTLNSEFNFKLQLAQLYGEQGNIEKMFINYIDFAEANPVALGTIKKAINEFISENSETGNNQLLRKILLKKLQQEPNIIWNDLLSWLFIQQKEYKKAFLQEKAIYNRELLSLDRIEELALIAANDNKFEDAKEIFAFIISAGHDLDSLLEANYNLLQIETKLSTKENYEAIDLKYQELLKQFGTFSQTLKMQIAYAHFLAFYKNETKKATELLEKVLELPLTEIEQAEVKLELGDILVLQEKFNEALIYFTQIQRNLKNSTISQQARFKVAQASYYKGDFKWAESQLKILKASTSQLIANDALDLKLLISDNKYEDSLQTALKLYAKADLLAFQNRVDESITVLDKILADFKTEPIMAQAFFKQAQLFTLKGQFVQAQVNYESIIDNYPDGVLIDDAYYMLAELNENQLNNPEKAKTLYEKIIFNHADSIYFVEARKRYRALRGDAIK
jgi:tetratricopeptide (TPR) repeat protein